MSHPGRIFSALLVMCLISACATKEVLIPKDAVVPTGTDLSGQWQLQDAIPDFAQRLNSTRTGNSAVRVFLELGTNLKITQTDFGIFVSFDRSIVEEYRFGENRAVSVGPISASRVSGWEGDSYIIETLDEDGDKLIERYRLTADGDALLRQIVLIVDRKQRLDLTQRFTRR